MSWKEGLQPSAFHENLPLNYAEGNAFKFSPYTRLLNLPPTMKVSRGKNTQSFKKGHNARVI